VQDDPRIVDLVLGLLQSNQWVGIQWRGEQARQGTCSSAGIFLVPVLVDANGVAHLLLGKLHELAVEPLQHGLLIARIAEVDRVASALLHVGHDEPSLLLDVLDIHVAARRTGDASERSCLISQELADGAHASSTSVSESRFDPQGHVQSLGASPPAMVRHFSTCVQPLSSNDASTSDSEASSSGWRTFSDARDGPARRWFARIALA
jgi:hypothetical protein